MIPYSKVSNYELKKIIKHFCVDIHAANTADLLGYNRKTINRYYHIFRECIYEHRMNMFEEKIGGNIEVDESYF